MRISDWKYIQTGDYQDIPQYEGSIDWFNRLISTLNQHIEQLTIAVQGNLSVGDNENSDVKTFSVEHNTPLTVTLSSLKGTPIGVIPIRTSVFDPYKFAWRQIDTNQIQVKFVFDSAPTERVEVTIVALGQ